MNSAQDAETSEQSFNSAQERRILMQEAQVVLNMMRGRDCRKNVREIREEFKEMLKEKGIFKNTSSLTNINLECVQLEKNLRDELKKFDIGDQDLAR